MVKTSPCRYEEMSLNPRTAIKSQVRCMHVISALEKWKQDDWVEGPANLAHEESSRLVRKSVSINKENYS